MQLDARHGVRYCWMFNSDARKVMAYVLGAHGYDLVATAAGDGLFVAPAFENFPIALAEGWE